MNGDCSTYFGSAQCRREEKIIIYISMQNSVSSIKLIFGHSLCTLGMIHHY